MAAILTAEDVVRRIAVKCAYVDDRGGVGIRLEPAATIVRRFLRISAPVQLAAPNPHRSRCHRHRERVKIVPRP
jgi:hypothetical protein